MQISSNDSVQQILASEKASIETSQKIAFAVAGKQLDAQKEAGAAIIELIQNAATDSDSIDVRRLIPEPEK